MDNFYSGTRGAWWRIAWGKTACFFMGAHVWKFNNCDAVCTRCGRYKFYD